MTSILNGYTMTGVLGQPVDQDEYDQTPPTPAAPGVLRNPTSADQVRAQEMALAWNAYQGKLADPLKRQKDGLNDNAKSNRLKPIVQKGASFLFPDGVNFSVAADVKENTAPDTGDVETGQMTAQECLNAFWKKNDQQTFLHKMAINGGIFGHVFVKLVPAKDVDETTGRCQSLPRLVLLNPQNVRVETEPDDCDMVRAYVISFKSGDPSVALQLERRQVIERVDPDGDAVAGRFDTDAMWRITDQHRYGNDQTTDWITDRQEAWPYEFAPIFDNQNLPLPNDFWGEPDITADLVELAMSVNFNQSNISRVLKWHASPLTVAKGVQGSIDRSPDNVVVIPENADLFNVEMHGDMHASLEFLQDLRDSMDEQSRVPAVALGRQESLPKGNLSGVALEMLFQPLVEKTNQKRGLYGPTVECISSAVLVLCGYAERIEDIPVTINWPKVLPTDPNADWQVAPIKMQVGVSRTTLLAEQGYDPAEEETLREAESEDDGEPAPPQPGQPAPSDGQPATPPIGVPLTVSRKGAPLTPGQQRGLNHPNAVAARHHLSSFSGHGAAEAAVLQEVQPS